MALRSDEVDLPVQVLPMQHGGPTGDPQFMNAQISLALMVEEAILQYRRDLRLSHTGSDVSRSFHQQVATVMAFSPLVFDRAGHTDIGLIQSTTLLILKQSICLELYARYLPLLVDLSMCLAMVSIAGDVLNEARALGYRKFDLLGPIIVRGAFPLSPPTLIRCTDRYGEQIFSLTSKSIAVPARLRPLHEHESTRAAQCVYTFRRRDRFVAKNSSSKYG